MGYSLILRVLCIHFVVSLQTDVLHAIFFLTFCPIFGHMCHSGISSAFHHITAAAHTTTVYVCKYLYRGGVQCVKVLSSFPLMAYNLSLNYLLLNAIKSKSRKM